MYHHVIKVLKWRDLQIIVSSNNIYPIWHYAYVIYQTALCPWPVVGEGISTMPTLCRRRLEKEPRLERRLNEVFDDADRLKLGCDGDFFLASSMLVVHVEFFRSKSFRVAFLNVLVEVERRRVRAENDRVSPAELLNAFFRCKKHNGRL